MADECRLSSRFNMCIILDLDRIVSSEKHADLLLICNEVVIVIEETRSMKSYDVDQVIQTLNDVKNNKKRYGILIDPSKFIGIIHSSKKFDPIAVKYLSKKTGKGFIIDKAECCDILIKKIEQIFYNRRINL
ncbi:hypothetical protein [Sulfurisphaera ohwakuensis]|uniref:Uncharacterized protein n=1 Tax=Sulfurisphaera ohwakuensis TaxID=69656 RepID=A0A650CHR1_SULOH|nr:hypothetical protein [Sulfurisphaera ohwakuensis]MBB5254795.1 hypothetical protein [Sulfurisphaera ohwakuensis]QGR17288.1 hypothetical protein D1869_08865 [Sulfurisphaera ohwakuensis]